VSVGLIFSVLWTGAWLAHCPKLKVSFQLLRVESAEVKIPSAPKRVTKSRMKVV
jgi:hypothetical protein